MPISARCGAGTSPCCFCPSLLRYYSASSLVGEEEFARRDRQRGQGPAAATALPTTPLACLVLRGVPGEGAEASPFDKEEKIIISKPRNAELLEAYLSR